MLQIKSHGYNITISNNVFKALNAFLATKNYTFYFILCDENTLQHCLPHVIINCKPLQAAQIIEIESGEKSKSIETASMIWQTLLEQQADKNTLIINLGGGVVSDLGGFCASVYKRGIDFIHIPTSLLAMADASVGGKTGIDFFDFKNILGTFSQPKAVFIEPDFLKTLPNRHLKNGLAEIFKIALVADKSFWKKLTTIQSNLSFIDYIFKSIELKNNIVLKDPLDSGLRKSLNFGHSIGHAIESLTMNEKDALLHGEAIVIGMMIESHMAYQKKLISKAILSEIILTLKTNFKPQKISNYNFDTIIRFIKNDKKNTKQKITFALISAIGKSKWDVQVSESQIEKAFVYFNSVV